MPPLTRWYIKSALVCLILGLLVGAAQHAPPGLGLPRVFAVAGPVYLHLLVVGWITQMIFGVAYWMFPKYSVVAPRGGDALAVASFLLLNAGLGLRVIAEPWHTLEPGPGLGIALAVAAAAQWLAGVAFFMNTWPRVKEK